MTPWAQVLSSIALVTGIPLVVVAVLSGTRGNLARWLPWLVSFGAGALIGAAVFHLLPEAYERHPTVGFVSLSVVFGVIGSYLAERLLHRVQHTAHEAPAGDRELAAFHDPAMVAVSAVSDGVHNFVDGALIAAAFLASPGAGMATSVAMLAHELPREVGTFGVFLHYGTSPRKAVMLTALTGGLAFVGAALTLWLGEETAHAAEVVIPVAAGAFLFVGGAVMASQLKAQRTWDLPVAQLSAFALGFGLSAVAGLLGGGH